MIPALDSRRLACFVVVALYLVGLTALAQTPTPAPTPPIVSKITLAWNAPPDPVAGYNVYASKTPAGSNGKFASPLAFQVQAPTTTYTFTNLADGTYYFAVTAVNAAGIESTTYSNIVTATLQATPPPPVTGLRIVSQTATPQTQRSARIEWRTNEPSTGKVFYGPSADKMTRLVRDNNLATSHKVKLTELKRRQSYVYQIVASTKTGGSATSAPATFALP